MTGRAQRIGELAAATGITVRTLHHYEEIGLLVPSRSEAGHRLYDQADVARLFRIVTLKRLGYGLSEIAEQLRTDEFDAREAVRRQLVELERQLELQEVMRLRLTLILDALEGAREPSADDLIEVMEVMKRMERYYSPEQMTKMDEHRRRLGDVGLRQGRQDWADLIAEFEAERQAGTDPDSERVQELAGRWKQLVEHMSGGDAGIRESMLRKFRAEGPEAASGGAVSTDLWNYVREAYAASTAN
jgi:MerR family transcriptional regulator, thiopeptide resistance regulator